MTVRDRLWNGETLRLDFADGLGFDTWVEKYGNPPRVFFEGRARPIGDFDDVVAAVERYLETERDLRVSWNAPIPTKRDRAVQ